MNDSNQTALLARAAGRARQRPEYLGWILARFAEAEQQTDHGLPDKLGVSMLDYHRLQLCLRPRAHSFATDVRQIAARFAADVGELAKIIRYVETLEGMKEEPVSVEMGEAGLLLAARARDKTSIPKKKGKNRGNRKES
jgi:hypothetical protein